jgi:Flp pilus assembly protein TadG
MSKTIQRSVARALLRPFLKRTDGAAAVEFALIIPVLAIIVIMLPDTSDIVFGAMNMNMAVRSSIQYAMSGGSSMSAAQTIGNQTWTNKPTGATLTAATVCTCNGSSATCGQTCMDGSQPYTYVTVTGAATFGGTVISVPLTTTQKVRVQ